ncbi:MAG: T9SS type A sorting domain-containing protein [Melioribacteraceae bacterium]|nr:T9SS type A sorting domain-containing protein [Melioribacteraceae bacterium]
MKTGIKIVPLIFLFTFAILSFVITSLLETKTSRVEVKRESGARLALQFWNRMRAYPNEDIPKNKFMEEYISVKNRMSKNINSTMDVEPWKAMGPLNVPGRMISLALNPQNSKTLYAGSATGGVWRTYNSTNGTDWQRIHTGFPTLGVMAIAIDPIDTLNMLIGTGETYGYSQSLGGYVWRTSRGSYGIGILKTTDGGVTWKKSLDWTFDQRRGIQDLAINPENNKTVFAATSEGISRSYDFGETWSEVYSVEMAQDIVIHLADTNKILVSTGNLGSADAGIYRSLDGGDSWSLLAGIPKYTGKTLMDIYQTNPDVVFADVADSLAAKGLYKTTDFGSSWTKINSNDIARYQGFFAHWVAVHPTDENKVVQAGVQITYSSNGGVSQSNIPGPHVDHHNFARDPNNDNILYIANDGGVYRSPNFGQSYANIGHGLQTAQFYNGFSSSYSDSNIAMGGLQDNNTVIYRGADDDWDRVIGGDGSWSAINSQNDNIMYGSWQRGNILRSTNQGGSFSNATSGIYGDAAFIAPYVISESNPSILYAGRKQVFKTENGGDSWVSVSSDIDGNEILSMSVSPQNPDVLFVGTAPVAARSHIYATLNGGDSWADVTENLPDRYPMDIAIDPNDSKTVYVVFGGYGSGHVYKSTNSGENWSDITGTLADVPTLSVIIDPFNSDYVYVGSDLGIFVSSDAGNNWMQFNDGLPEAVMGMDLNISHANRSLWVATHGNGAYRRPLLFSPDFYLTVSMVDLPASVLKFSELTFEALFRNVGSNAQSEDYSVKARLLNPDGDEVYSNTQTLCCLESNESRTISFDGSYVLDAVGNYTFELIKFGNSQQPDADTVHQVIRVFEPASIAYATVEKLTKIYSAITGGVSFNGDDIQRIINLPFNFTYDEYEYNQMQISTNGWLEFGIGTAGTERGVSTASQIGTIGANENGRMAGTARPTKALGPWWEDLNGDGDGKVRYSTVGTSPNRVFVTQWEHMRAYWDPNATTARVNFQVRLYESTNTIEYCYGNVETGTFGGSDIGASIGFKDHIGGDYRFYDIIAGESLPAGDVITDLSPLTDWPGENTVYKITTLITDVDNIENNLPSKFVLEQNYPNPFNPSTTIRYQIPKEVRGKRVEVRLVVYDVLGREVAVLVNKEQSAGSYEVQFDASGLTSGIYFYKLNISTGSTNSFNKSMKMILLK